MSRSDDSTEYGYDPNGDLTSVKDPRANTTTYGYDKLGRLVEVTQPLEKTTTYSYDAAGNPLTETTAAGTLKYGYDADNHLAEVKAGESTLRSFGYDAVNRLASATDAASHKIEIGYDEDSLRQLDQRRPWSVADPRLQLARRADETGRRPRHARIWLRQTRPPDLAHRPAGQSARLRL